MDKQRDLVVVAGATGKQGGAVARELLRNGCRVRALTRHPESPAAEALRRLGAQVARTDFDDERSIEEALRGAWGTFAIQNTWEAGVEREEEQGKRYAQVARRAGIRHYVYTSVGSAHRDTGIPHFDNKWRVEETIRSLGFPSTVVLRPVFFMENWVGPWFRPGLEEGKLAVALQPSTRLQMVAVEDVGRFGAAAFVEHERWNGSGIDIAGDERTMPETAAVLSRLVGKPVEFQPVPIEEVRKGSEDYARMLEWFDAVGYDVDIARLPERYGIRPITLEQWAAKQRW